HRVFFRVSDPRVHHAQSQSRRESEGGRGGDFYGGETVGGAGDRGRIRRGACDSVHYACRLVRRMTPQTLLRKLFPPMLATLTDAPPGSESGWTYELKYDGFRGVCAKTGGAMALWSRNELDLGKRFPNIVEALEKWKADEIVVDGEIVALNVEGVPKFELLQQGNVRERYVLFDV